MGRKEKGMEGNGKRREERKERKQHCKEMDLTSKPGLCFGTFFSIHWEESSQLTHIFQRGRSTTNQKQ